MYFYFLSNPFLIRWSCDCDCCDQPSDLDQINNNNQRNSSRQRIHILNLHEEKSVIEALNSIDRNTTIRHHPDHQSSHGEAILSNFIGNSRGK